MMFLFSLCKTKKEKADSNTTVKKTCRGDTLHKEGVPPVFENSGFMLFSFVVAFLPYGVGNRLPNLPI